MPLRNALEELEVHLRFYRVPKGQCIVEFGFPADTLILVISGTVGLHSGEQGKEGEVRRKVHKGGLIGGVSYIMAAQKFQCSTRRLVAEDDVIIAYIEWDRNGKFPVSDQGNRLISEQIGSLEKPLTVFQRHFLLEEFLLSEQRLRAFGMIMMVTVVALSFLNVISTFSTRYILDIHEYSNVTQITPFAFAMITAPILYVYTRQMRLPKLMRGLYFFNISTQLVWALLISLPPFVAMVGVRMLLYPSEAAFSIFALSDETHFKYETLWLINLGFLGYIFFLAPIQQFLFRSCLQVSLETVLGARQPYSMPLSNLIIAICFSVSHIMFNVWAVLLTFPISLYWGWIFQRKRSLLMVIVSHILLGTAAFYWFGLIRPN
ncbi:CPBP family glutamic-type intramembrane protease [Pseudovibrio axinellae]|nr:CPBP family glutamic-type intramembrane protease [Pseudovibrio axinellae]